MTARTTLFAAALLLASQAQATTWFEVGDAIELLPGQSLAAGTTAVVGSIDNTTDFADLYAFSWGGGVLAVDTVGSAFDTQLHLFDSTGAGIAENDDGNGLGFLSAIELNLAAGLYYLAISDFNYDAVGAGGSAIFGFTNPFLDLGDNEIQGPTGSGPLVGWDGNAFGAAGAYAINFNTAVVPVPAALWLFAPAILGLFGVRRRNR